MHCCSIRPHRQNTLLLYIHHSPSAQYVPPSDPPDTTDRYIRHPQPNPVLHQITLGTCVAASDPIGTITFSIRPPRHNYLLHQTPPAQSIATSDHTRPSTHASHLAVVAVRAPSPVLDFLHQVHAMVAAHLSKRKHKIIEATARNGHATPPA